ncbi:uncharacterized protein LOC129372241 isoform X2 [Poeciliopsis prolifica]|nr:uncharacterized protein LOC129372241 isoform X2 [Poeciliopsis prolifica]
MEGFADLLTDAFSEGSVPSFSTGDLDFESLCFDEKSEEEQNKNPVTENNEARLQEASAEGAASLQGPNADAPNSDDKEQTDEENDEEGLNGARFSSETPEDDECSSSDEEERSYFCSGRGGEEEAEGPEEEDDRLKSIYETVHGILEDEDSEILEDVDELQVSNKLQEEVHSDEEEDGCRNANAVESPESEEEQEVEPDSSESDDEGVKTEEEEKEEPSAVDPADFGLEFSCISLQNLEDLISEVDGEVYREKMSDFTGEEHQEAGESFADYPSDFSSGEYGRNAAAARSASPRPREEAGLERAGTESVWSHGSEEAGSGKEEEFLFSRDIEVNVEKMMMSLDEAAGDEVQRKTEHLLSGTSFDDEEKTSESDSYSSSEDEEPLRRSSDVFSDKSRTRVLEDDTNLENIKSLGASGSDDGSFVRDRHDPAEFLTSGFGELETKTFLYEFFLSGEDTDGTESPNSGRNQCPDQDVNRYSVVEKKNSIPASPFVQGSIDDSFFFNTEPNDFTDDGQQEEEEEEQEEEEEEDEYEERRNFEQMKQRIEAFKKFYDNCDDENGQQERQIKVQFCADPLSQVNYYETDSDRDSVSSSSDREEDLSSVEQSDDKEDLNPAEQSEDKEEDLNPAEQSEDKEEDLNPAEQSEDNEEDLNPAEQSEDTEDDLSSGEQFEDEDEDSSSAEQSDEPREPEEDQDIKPVFDPPIVQQHQSPADVVNTQTCTATRKSFRTLKLIVTLGVLTVTGLMMFYLTTDQPDWLTQFLFY